MIEPCLCGDPYCDECGPMIAVYCARDLPPGTKHTHRCRSCSAAPVCELEACRIDAWWPDEEHPSGVGPQFCATCRDAILAGAP